MMMMMRGHNVPVAAFCGGNLNFRDWVWCVVCTVYAVYLAPFGRPLVSLSGACTRHIPQYPVSTCAERAPAQRDGCMVTRQQCWC